MFRGKDLPNNLGHGVENSDTKVSGLSPGQNLDCSDEQIGLSHRCSGVMREYEPVSAGFQSKPTEAIDSGAQELTFSYLCDNNRLGLQDEDFGVKISPNLKGKEPVSEKFCQEEGWVERDFLQLNENRGVSSKREFLDDTDIIRDGDKKQKLETLKLTLALPDVSLTLGADPVQNENPLGGHKSIRSTQSLAPSSNHTQTTCSNDFAAASLSYSYSHQFSHNPSCSLTRNSTDCNNQIWHCGEGTNGSVQSRFKPVGDGVASANHSGVGHALMNGSHRFNNDISNSLHRPGGSDNTSFFPSELPAKPGMENLSGGSRVRVLDQPRGLEANGPNRSSKPETILLEIVSGSIPMMAKILQELPDEPVHTAMEFLKSLITGSDGKDQLVSLNKRLEQRHDLTAETLSKAHKVQLQIMVAVRFGLADFVSGKLRISTPELVEIFFRKRCQNVNCKSLLPVDDCDCKICSSKKGFCSQCMCPVCFKFDFSNSTCSWIGCDVCAHWCHAACGIEHNLIRPGRCLKGPSGMTEVQFHCLGCGHASEMFGFVKDVFMYFAKDWSLQTLIKELHFVRRIFRGSEDARGRQLNQKAEEMIANLERRVMSASDACQLITRFFTYTDELVDLPDSGILSKAATDLNPGTVTVAFNKPRPLPESSMHHNPSASFQIREPHPPELYQSALIPFVASDRRIEDKSSGKRLKNDGFDSLESIVRVKQAEARMFQMRADEARKEAEGYRQIARGRIDKVEEDYSEKLAKLCLKETEERRRKRLEDLKISESSHCDYYEMKTRMQAEIAGLLERMEASKRQ